ncbi:MAG: hypothetical protein K5766_04300 [Alphaproteobacteria bacterium]|nr:hypothetical protein [Alphaproteobacteria bacterium]
MKNLVLIFGLIVVTLSDTNAMRTVVREFDNRVPFLLVRVPSNPPIEILNLPSEQKVILDGELIARSINLQSDSYNNVPMRAPLVLQYDMDDSTFLDNVYAAFGRACQYEIGSINKNTLSRNFGI